MILYRVREFITNADLQIEENCRTCYLIVWADVNIVYRARADQLREIDHTRTAMEFEL